MVFSSNIFLFGFAPLFFALYFLLPASARNWFIFLASLVFYAFGAGGVVLVLFASSLLNWLAGRIMATANAPARRCTLIAAVAINLAMLFYYKYAGFFWDAGNDLTGGALGATGLARPLAALPIGISFFTFQALSYLADVYGGEIRPARKFVDFGMYHTLFAQLIAGPIVRYREIEASVTQRRTTLDMAAEGAVRFACGLAKKVIIADSAGKVADAIFALPVAQLGFTAAWLGAASYAVQILFDFSGYSDMAIGLGLLMGFRFPENFNAPYLSESVTEFWRRWHMTLSRWFRDYVYIPLGGNRRGTLRTYLNLAVVFVLCGLWHGAAYTFLIWGMFHGALLAGERFLSERWHFTPRGVGGRLWTLLMVVIGWVVFRAGSVTQATDFLRAMCGLATSRATLAADILTPDRAAYLLLGALFALLPLKGMAARLPQSFALQRAAALLLFAWAAMQLAADTFHPFLYFRF